MPEYANITDLGFIDVIVEGVQSQFFGSFHIAFLGLLAFVIIGLMMVGSRREAVLMIPIPMLYAITFTTTTEFKWLLVIALLGYGFYVSKILWNLLSQK